ncbi:hypothetical protein E2C01_033686 [Portunus trituberculatus]|uniref:Uncharacterized protein n=1 Tax=Portunus trituberculatus TaxID=210409 RepID=A0A5B7EZH0_PORTR|nr:hypothetical protein [Portunus trituberculatus]
MALQPPPCSRVRVAVTAGRHSQPALCYPRTRVHCLGLLYIVISASRFLGVMGPIFNMVTSEVESKSTTMFA